MPSNNNDKLVDKVRLAIAGAKVRFRAFQFCPSWQL